MAHAPHLSAPDRRSGPHPRDLILPRASQLERYAELLWTQLDAPAAWSAQQSAVQDVYRRMAATLRTTVLTEVMARSGSERARQEVIRLRAEIAEERARMAERVERLEEYIRHVELCVSLDTARSLRALAGLQPGDLDPGDVRAGHRAS